MVWLFPNFLGSKAAIVTEEGRVHSLHVVKLPYVGLIQIWLLWVWLSLRAVAAPAQRHRVESLLLAAIVMTGFAMLAYRALDRVPLLRLLGPEHFLVGNAFAFAVASAAAGDTWLGLDPEECKRAITRLLIYVPLMGVLGFVCVFTYRNVPRGGALPFWMQAAAAGALSVALLLLLAYTVPRPSVRVMGYGVSVLTLVSLLAAFGPSVKYLDPGSVFPETEFIASLKGAGERVGGSTALASWPLAGNLIPQVFCPSGVMLRRHAAFLERLQNDPLMLRRAGASALLLTKEDIQGTFASIRPMLSIKRVFSSGAVLFNDLGTKPRAWVAHDWRPIKEFTPAALSPSEPPVVETTIAPANNAPGPESTAAIQEPESNGRVRINVDGPRPGILMLADAYYPGWKATVDGEAAEVLRADGMFRGVLIKGGPHEVEFRYDPFSLRLGLYITAGAAVIVLFELRRVFRRY